MAAELISYEVVIKGRIPAESRAAATEYIRNHLQLNFPMHESIDDLRIMTEPSAMEEMKVRFPG